MRNHLSGLVVSLLAIPLTNLCLAAEAQWPYNLPPNSRYYPEDEALVGRNLEAQKKLEIDSPNGVRKMSGDASEMFFPEYWSFGQELGMNAALDRRRADEAEERKQNDWQQNTSTISSPQLPLLLHNSSPNPRVLLPRRLSPKLAARDFSCPSGTSSCANIGRSNSCCANGLSCNIITDTGLGDVGCCAAGTSCSGQVVGCQADYTSCPGQGGGCCIPGFQCSGVGCECAPIFRIYADPSRYPRHNSNSDYPTSGRDNVSNRDHSESAIDDDTTYHINLFGNLDHYRDHYRFHHTRCYSYSRSYHLRCRLSILSGFYRRRLLSHRSYLRRLGSLSTSTYINIQRHDDKRAPSSRTSYRLQSRNDHTPSQPQCLPDRVLPMLGLLRRRSVLPGWARLRFVLVSATYVCHCIGKPGSHCGGAADGGRVCEWLGDVWSGCGRWVLSEWLGMWDCQLFGRCFWNSDRSSGNYDRKGNCFLGSRRA